MNMFCTGQLVVDETRYYWGFVERNDGVIVAHAGSCGESFSIHGAPRDFEFTAGVLDSVRKVDRGLFIFVNSYRTRLLRQVSFLQIVDTGLGGNIDSGRSYRISER